MSKTYSTTQNLMIRVLSAPYLSFILYIFFHGPKIWNSLLNDIREFWVSEEIFTSAQSFWVNFFLIPCYETMRLPSPLVVDSVIRFLDTDLSLFERHSFPDRS